MSALLLEPGLPQCVHIDTLDMVNFDRDIVATGAYTTSMRQGQGASSIIVGNLCSQMRQVQSTMIVERLHSAVQESYNACPEIHKECGSPDFHVGRQPSSGQIHRQVPRTGQEHQASQPLQHTKWIHESTSTRLGRNNRMMCHTLQPQPNI